MESRYKRPLAQTSVKSRIQIREQKLLVRRSERYEALMQRRNILAEEETKHNVPYKSGKKQATVPHQLQSKQKDYAKTSQERKAQLQRYKEQKLMQKKIEKEMAKPVFKVSQHIKFNDPFGTGRQLGPKNTALYTEKRVTRSTAKRAADNKVSTNKSNLRHTSLIAVKTKMGKDTSVFLAPTKGAPKTTKVVKKEEKERKSFAPENFAFNPPASWRTPVVEVTRIGELTKTEEFLAAFLLNPQLSHADSKNGCDESLSSTKKREVKKVLPLKPLHQVSSESPKCVQVSLNSLHLKREPEVQIGLVTSPCAGKIISIAEVNRTISSTSPHAPAENLSIPSSNGILNNKVSEEIELKPSQCDNSCSPVKQHNASFKASPKSEFEIGNTAENVAIYVEETESGIKSSSKEADALIPEENCGKCDCVVCVCKKDITQFVTVSENNSPIPTNCSGSAVKRHRIRFAVGLECSPWITTSRGSSSRKKRQSLSKTAMLTPNDIPSYPSNIFDDGNEEEQAKGCSNENRSLIPNSELSTQYFEDLVSKQKQEFNQKISFWNDVENSTFDIPEKALGQIHCVVGLARLLMDQRIKQFEGLILDCKLKRGEKETTCEDLLGFWEMVILQVKDIYAKFNDLEVLKSRSWQEPESAKAVRRKKVIKKPLVKKAASSSLRKFLSEARKGKSTVVASGEEDSIFNAQTVDQLTPSRRRSGRKRSVIFSADKRTQTPIRQKSQDVMKTGTENLSPAMNLLGAVCNGTQGIEPLRPRRKSVRFSVNEDHHPDTVSKYRTTPFSSRKESKLAMDELSSSVTGSLELSFKDDEANPTTDLPELNCATKVSKREPSLLPMPVVEVQNVVRANGDLMHFSPLASIENTPVKQTPSKSKTINSVTPLRRSSRFRPMS